MHTEQLLEQKISNLETQLAAKNRELEIEAALEKVRARTMAMQHQDDLLELITLLAEQLVHLGVDLDGANFSTGLPEKDWDLWVYNRYAPPGTETRRVLYPWKDIAVFHAMKAGLENFKKGIDLNVAVFNKVDKDNFLDYIWTDTIHKDEENPDGLRETLYNFPGWTWSVIYLSNSWVVIHKWNIIPFTDEQNKILRRFANAFGQAYTRFLDLQKAEAQTREAQIENALEKVRSRSLAMHKSDELQEVFNSIYDRFIELNIKIDAVNFLLFIEGSKDLINYTGAEGRFYKQTIVLPNMDFGIMKDLWDAVESGKDFVSLHYSFDEKNRMWQKFFEITDLKYAPEERKKFILEAECWVTDITIEKHSCIELSRYSHELFSEKDHEVQKRFARVFEQAYIRFLDLQKAEAQAREAQIEVSLERVRGKAMAMHNSEDLAATIRVMYEELSSLSSVPIIRFGAGIYRKDKHVGDIISVSKTSNGELAEVWGEINMESTDV